MAAVLGALVERSAAKEAAVDERLRTLITELNQIREKLSRLYQAIEDVIVETDEEVKECINNLKARRDVIDASLGRIAEQASVSAVITPDRIFVFTLVRQKLDDGEILARKAYLRAIIARIEVDDDEVRVLGDKTVLAETVTGRRGTTGNVRGFVRKWCTREDSNLWPLPSEGSALSS